MEKLLTICIVTKNHSIDILKLLIDHKIMPYFSKVNWIISDNSTNASERLSNIKYAEEFKVKYVYSESFSEARNKAIELVKTKYFMFLDDDDYLTKNFYTYIENILIYDNPDFLSLGFRKEGRTYRLNNRIRKIKNKYLSLNNFDNYEKDRRSKVYLSAGSIIFNKDFWIKNKIKFIFDKVDDIYPVTKMYLLSKNPMICSKLCYIYRTQRSVTSKKSKLIKSLFLDDMTKSYSLLLSEFKDKASIKVINKSINNSRRQLTLNDDIKVEEFDKKLGIK